MFCGAWRFLVCSYPRAASFLIPNSALPTLPPPTSHLRPLASCSTNHGCCCSPPLRILVLPQTRPRSPPRKGTSPHGSRSCSPRGANPKRPPGRFPPFIFCAFGSRCSSSSDHSTRGREYGGGSRWDARIPGGARR